MKRVRSIGLSRVNTRRTKSITPYGALVRISEQVSETIHQVANQRRHHSPEAFMNAIANRISKWLEVKKNKHDVFGGAQVIIELNPKLRLVVYKVAVAYLMQNIESAIWTDYVRERCTGDDVLIGQVTPYGYKVMVQDDCLEKS